MCKRCVPLRLSEKGLAERPVALRLSTGTLSASVREEREIASVADQFVIAKVKVAHPKITQPTPSPVM